MKYTIFWTDNARCANRGSGKDTFSKDVYEFDSDREALLKAMGIQDCEEINPEDVSEYSDEDLSECLFDIDLGSGYPVVFWIKKGSKKIYDAGISLKDWN